VRTILALSVLACLSASPRTLGQTRSNWSKIASRSVSSFNIQQLNMIDALLQLGQEQRIPVGIEYIDAAAFRSRITLHEQGTTVGKLLDTITNPLGYSWFVDGDVVMVTHSGAPQGSKNLLDSRIPEFSLKRDATLQAASLRLIGELYFVQHPHATGIGGDYPSGNPQFRVGPWTMRNATVRRILNRIVSQHNNGAWVVQQAPWNMDKELSYGLWRVFEYDGNNSAKFSALLQVWGLGLHDPE
jgi:hypothetical protein